MPRIVASAVLLPFLLSCSASTAGVDFADPVTKVEAVERAFARTMADRDHDAFVSHLSEHAIFLTGGGALHGKEAVAAGWKPLFEGAQAPFSWEPEEVIVLGSGDLAWSSGPVRDPAGETIGRFHSTWRLEDDGVWRVVFDRGD